MVLLRLDKWELDDAHKDKTNKIYAPDFRVSVYFYTDFYLMDLFDNV